MACNNEGIFHIFSFLYGGSVGGSQGKVREVDETIGEEGRREKKGERKERRGKDRMGEGAREGRGLEGGEREEDEGGEREEDEGGERNRRKVRVRRRMCSLRVNGTRRSSAMGGVTRQVYLRGFLARAASHDGCGCGRAW